LATDGGRRMARKFDSRKLVSGIELIEVQA